MSTQRSIEGRVGVMSFLQSFVLGTSYIFNISLVFYSKSFNEAVFGILKLFGGFCIPIKIGIPFCLFDLDALAFKCTS